MSKETLQKYASLSQANKKKCFALGGWCNRQGNIFTMQEVFDCLYDAADGNFDKLTALIEQLTTKGKVFGRSSVVFGSDNAQMSIRRGEDGKLKIAGYNPSFRPPEKGQHTTHEPQVLRKDGQVRKNVINSQEKLYDLGQSVREIYQGQSNEFITVAMAAIKGFAKAHKISEMTVVERLKKGVYTLNMENGLENARIIPKMKTIKLNESQLNELADATKLTEYKFYNNVQRFLSDLLRDPVGAKVPFLLQANNILRNQLLYHLKSNGIINRHQKISDRDSQGNPKTAKMIIKYSVPKKDFAKKMKKLFIAMVAKNVPQKNKKILSEGIESIENNLTDSKYMVVYHSSGADFGEFDTKNHGYEGEGAMVHGFGTYFSTTEKTAQDYFRSSGHFGNKNTDTNTNIFTNRQKTNNKQIAQEIWAIEKKISSIYSEVINEIARIPFNDSSLVSLIKDDFEMIFEDITDTKILYVVNSVNLKRYLSSVQYVIEDLGKVIYYLQNNKSGLDLDFIYALMSEENFRFKKDIISIVIEAQKQLIHYANEFSKLYTVNFKSMDTIDDYSHGIFYMAQIPKNNGTNYLTETEPLNDTQLSILVKGLKSNGFDVRFWEKSGVTTVANSEGKHQVFTGKTFKYVYNRVLIPLFGSKEGASNFLSSLGFTGIEYYGGEDGLCYVVFNDSDINIMWKNKDEIEQNLDECDCGGAMGATAGNESMGQYSQPLFGVQRRKMPTEIDETTTASNVTQNGDISMGVAVPFGGDKETLDRTPGFSVERQDESIDELEVLHGSRNKFDKFNHKDNLGKGAGSQFFGWGSYFTDDDSVAQGYVDSFRGDQSNVFQDGMLHLFSYAKKELDKVDNETLGYMYTGSTKCFKNGYTKKKMLGNIYNIVEYLKRCLGYVTSGNFRDLYLFAKQYLIYLVDFNELIANSYLGDIDKFDIQKDGNRYCIRRGNEFVPIERITDDERSMLIEYMNALISSYERVYKWVFDKLQNTELFEPRKSYKYNVTIPDDNGDNYLSWYEPLSRNQFEAIYEALVQSYQNNELNQNMSKFLPMEMLEDGNKEFFYTAMTRREFKETYRMLSTFFGSQEGASTFLMNKLGYDGIKYPAGTRWGKPDGASDEAYNYVLFDADKSEINNVEEFEPLLEYLDKRMSKVRNDFKTKNYDESSGFSWSDDSEDGKEIIHNEWMIHFSDDAPKISHEGFTQGNDYDGKLKSATYRRGKTEGGYNYAYLASDVIGHKYWRFFNYLKDRQTPFVMFKGNGYRFYHEQDGEDQVVLNNVQSDTKVLVMNLYDQWCVLTTNNPEWKNRKKDISPRTEDEHFAMNNTRNILDGVIYSDDDINKVIKWVMTNFDQYRNKFKY